MEASVPAEGMDTRVVNVPVSLGLVPRRSSGEGMADITDPVERVCPTAADIPMEKVDRILSGVEKLQQSMDSLLVASKTRTGNALESVGLQLGLGTGHVLPSGKRVVVVRYEDKPKFLEKATGAAGLPGWGWKYYDGRKAKGYEGKTVCFGCNFLRTDDVLEVEFGLHLWWVFQDERQGVALFDADTKKKMREEFDAFAKEWRGEVREAVAARERAIQEAVAAEKEVAEADKEFLQLGQFENLMKALRVVMAKKEYRKEEWDWSEAEQFIRERESKVNRPAPSLKDTWLKFHKKMWELFSRGWHGKECGSPEVEVRVLRESQRVVDLPESVVRRHEAKMAKEERRGAVVISDEYAREMRQLLDGKEVGCDVSWF